MIGGVFGTIANKATELVGGIVEDIKDVATDIRPTTVASTIAPEASATIFAVDQISQVLRRSSEGRAAESQPVIRSTVPMPHVEGHMDGELPVGGVGLENVNTALVGVGSQIIQGIGRNLLRQLPRGTGGAATGVAGGIVGGLLMDGSGAGCGCEPKPFVRMDKCGRPIITRKMKKQAIEAVNCQGAEVAAATLTGGSLELLTMITSKQFPPRRMGISGAQMATTERTQRKLMRFHKRMTEACKAPARRRTR